MANVKGYTLPTLITGAVGPVLVYKKRPAPADLQWTGCGSESVPISGLILILNFS